MAERFVERTPGLAGALESRGIRWTHGGKINFRGGRVGHLSSNGFNVEIHDDGRPELNGELRLLAGAAHVENELRAAFNEALAKIFDREKSEAKGSVDEAVEAARKKSRALFEDRI